MRLAHTPSAASANTSQSDLLKGHRPAQGVRIACHRFRQLYAFTPTPGRCQLFGRPHRRLDRDWREFPGCSAPAAARANFELRSECALEGLGDGRNQLTPPRWMDTEPTVRFWGHSLLLVADGARSPSMRKLDESGVSRTVFTLRLWCAALTASQLFWASVQPSWERKVRMLPPLPAGPRK